MKNEMLFGNWLIRKFTKKYNAMVTRLESHHTANGIPDLFVCGYSSDAFIELKADNKITVSDVKVKVDWRPGQQGWAIDYAINHHYKKNVVTLIGAADGIILVPQDRVYKNDTVENPIYLDSHDVTIYNLLRWVYMHSYVPTNVTTYWGLMLALRDNIYAKMWGMDIDAPPETIIPEETLQEQVAWTTPRYHELVQVYFELCEEVALNNIA